MVKLLSVDFGLKVTFTILCRQYSLNEPESHRLLCLAAVVVSAAKISLNEPENHRWLGLILIGQPTIQYWLIY